VFDSDHKLRHLPFFEEVASRDEGTPEWHAATAGVVVLRLVDAWLEDGTSVATDDGWGVRSVRCAIDAMDEGTPIRAILGRVVDALEQQRPDIHVVVTPLMAYARSLEYEAKWMLAADVYQSVLAHVHPVEDSDASIAAQLRLGQCYRNLGQIDEAADAFEAASEIAISVGDFVGILRARIGDAQVAIMRGNLPQAQTILDETIAKATTPELRAVRSRALHDRAGVATLTGHYDLAIRLAYEALEHSESASERDRILGDVAAAFAQLGVFSAARDAYLVLSATAQEQYTRWTAMINLMEIAGRSGAETQFEQYRRELVGQALPPLLHTGMELSLGLGYRQFGQPAKARVHLERAVAMAGEHGLNQFLFEAEEALFQLDSPTPPPRAEEVSLDVSEVARALRELRDSVGVA
jgi:tetratricopeptide (TPR) repeat protein